MERGLGALMIAGPGRLKMKRVGGVSGRGLSFCNRCPKKVDFVFQLFTHPQTKPLASRQKATDS